MATELLSVPMNSMVLFHTFVNLPEGRSSIKSHETAIFLGFSHGFPMKNGGLPPICPWNIYLVGCSGRARGHRIEAGGAVPWDINRGL